MSFLTLTSANTERNCNVHCPKAGSVGWEAVIILAKKMHLILQQVRPMVGTRAE